MRTSREEARADRARRSPQIIDLARSEWEEVGVENKHVDMHTIASFWVLTAALLFVMVAAPALEAAAHHVR